MTTNPYKCEVIGSLYRPQYFKGTLNGKNRRLQTDANMDETTPRARLEVLTQTVRDVWK